MKGSAATPVLPYILAAPHLKNDQFAAGASVKVLIRFQIE